MKVATASLLGIAWLAAAAAMAAAGCSSLRTDEGLAMLDVSVAADVAPFTTARFSIAGRPEVRSQEIPYDGKSPLRFGYYLPGPSGTLRVTGQALSANCIVGSGTAEATLQLGKVSAAIPLVIKRAAEIDPTCAAQPDGSTDGDAATSGDGATKPPPPDAGPPACLAATKPCSSPSACCGGLNCATTSLGRVCCGNFGMSCTRPGGEDCCGQLECINGGCCLPATYACSGGSCCTGLVCGTTSLGHTCCGNSGTPCIRPDGADCCGALRCVNNVCRT